MSKYEQFIQIVKEDYDNNSEITADEIETLVHKGIIDESVIDSVVTGDADEDVVGEIIGIATIYDDFTYGFHMDEEENHENKNSDEY